MRRTKLACLGVVWSAGLGLLWGSDAWADEPRVRFDVHGHLVWAAGDRAAVLDLNHDALVAGGPVASVDAEHPPPEPDALVDCGPRTGVAHDAILARDGRMCVVRDGAAGTRLRVFSEGLRLWRAELPDWWGDRYTQVAFTSNRVVLYDGRTLLDVDGDRALRSYEVGAGHGEMAFDPGRTRVAFSGRPDRLVDLFEQRVIDLPDLAVSDVSWRSDTVVGTVGSGESRRAAVWDADGDLRFVLDRPDYGTRRLSPDGRALGVVFVGEEERRAKLLDTTTGEALQAWSVCADGHRIWPVSADRIVDFCGDAVWLRGPLGEEVLGRMPGGSTALLDRPVRNVTMSDEGLRIVTGDGSHGLQVWTVPLGAGPGTLAVREQWEPVAGKDGQTVKGYEGGTPRTLVVEDVHGTPVEVATARAYRRMARAAKADGVTLSIASGFRTNAEQAALYDCYLTGDCNGGNLAAPPGHSNHQSGLALDLNTHVRSVRRWLERHGSEYGFARTVRSEPWHWEYVGGERQPAVSVAILPPAEPRWKAPRTPWTPEPDALPAPPIVQPAPVEKPPPIQSEAVAEAPPDSIVSPWGSTGDAVPEPEPRNPPVQPDPFTAAPRNEPSRRARRESRTLQSIFF